MAECGCDYKLDRMMISGISRIISAICHTADEWMDRQRENTQKDRHAGHLTKEYNNKL